MGIQALAFTEEEKCNEDRIWNLICRPLCGLPLAHSHDDITTMAMNCYSRCRAPEEDLAIIMWLYRLSKDENCRAEMRKGWKPPSWVMESEDILLRRVQEHPLLDPKQFPNNIDPNVWKTPGAP